MHCLGATAERVEHEQIKDDKVSTLLTLEALTSKVGEAPAPLL